MTMLPLPGVHLYYEVHGDGPPIVLLHGAGTDHHGWWQQVPTLRERNAVVLMDLRGFGRSRPRGDHDPADASLLVDDVAALLDYLGFSRDVALLGHSLGTIPALGFAARHPDRVRALILSSGYGTLRTAALADRIDECQRAFGAPQPQTLGVEGTCRSADEREAFAMFERQPNPFGPNTVRERPDLAFLYAAMARDADGPSLSELAPIFASEPRINGAIASSLAFPVLVTGGAHDMIFAPDELAEASRSFARGSFVLFPDSGHSPSFEQGAAFNGVITRFLEGRADFAATI